MTRERPLQSVPPTLWALLALAVILKLVAHLALPPPAARAEDLPPVPDQAMLRLAALGDTPAMARWLMLYIQAFDSQPGIAVPYKALDYRRLETWLDRILDLDPRSQYPLLAAARLYGEVPVPEKQRIMLGFVERRFLEEPNLRWSWLVHASLVARHRLGDMELARHQATLLRRHATGPGVPGWARQMEALILEDMGELDDARMLLSTMVDSGQIQDPAELRFLVGRLQSLEARAKKP